MAFDPDEYLDASVNLGDFDPDKHLDTSIQNPPAAPYQPTAQSLLAGGPSGSQPPVNTGSLGQWALGGGEALLHGASGAIVSTIGGITGHKYADVERELTYQPQTEQGKALVAGGRTALDALTYPGRAVAASSGVPELEPVVNTPIQMGAAYFGSRGMTRPPGIYNPKLAGVEGIAVDPRTNLATRVAPEPPPPTLQAPTYGPAAGASGAVIDLSTVSPELRDAAQRAGASVNQEALERHIRAETLPMQEGESPLRLMKGQATRDSQQISDERNMRADPDTQGVLTNAIDDQNRKLVGSIGEIRRAATPDIVQRNNLEHGQAGVDAIRAVDNAAVLDTRAKYKAMADANGGAIPIDTGAAVGNIDTQLSKSFLTKTAAENPAISEIMDSLRSGQPISFEQFENARTNLAEAQRGGGSEAKAAAIVRQELENLPLPKEAQGLKTLANSARTAARNRFNTIEQNPAYKAAVEDGAPKDENGLHVIGSPSPVADSFVNRYFTGNGPAAARAYVQRIKGVMQSDPTFSQSIEAASLNNLRDAAGVDANGNGGFNAASYRNARNAIDKKADLLMSPESAARTQQLADVAGDIAYEGKGGFTNRSNTALTLQRFGAQAERGPSVAGTVASHLGDVAAAHGGPVTMIAKRVGETVFKGRADAKAAQALKEAKLKFATDATAPGAGISNELPR